MTLLTGGGVGRGNGCIGCIGDVMVSPHVRATEPSARISNGEVRGILRFTDRNLFRIGRMEGMSRQLGLALAQIATKLQRESEDRHAPEKRE
jgi:hypothetical protein